MTEKSNPSYAKMRELWWSVEEFIRDNQITAPETVYQSDAVVGGATEFIEELCNIVGYHKDADP